MPYAARRRRRSISHSPWRSARTPWFRGFPGRGARLGDRIGKQKIFEYALVDIRMPGGSGVDLVRALRAIDEGTRIVVLAGYGTIANAVEAMRAGVFDYFTKPGNAAVCARALLWISGPGGSAEDVPSLDRVEWEYLNRVLADCCGNVSEAARRLRLHRGSRQRKMGKLPPYDERSHVKI